MSDEVRSEVRRLLDETGITQTQVIRELNANEKYRCTKSEFSIALRGYDSPKSRRLLHDALTYLVKERMRTEALLEISKSH